MASFNAEPGKLKEVLDNKGYRFPCGGKGLCGRCRIKAPALSVTSLDKRFLSEDELDSGLRLACDKIIDSPIEIEEVYMQKQQASVKMESPDIAACLGDYNTEITVTEDEYLDSVVLPAEPAVTVALRAVVGKNSVEFFEKYGAAKATTILVAGTADRMAAFSGLSYSELAVPDVYEAGLFDMPAEEVYLPPVPSENFGSAELLEIAEETKGAVILLLNYEKVKIVGIDDAVISVYNLCKTAELLGEIKDGVIGAAVKCVAAGLRYALGDIDGGRVVFVGESLNKETVSGVFGGLNIEIRRPEAQTNALKALETNRYRAKLLKLARLVAERDLLLEDGFFEHLNILS